MLKVLKAVPGVSDPRLGSVTSEGWTHPFLEYRAAEETRWIEPTRFDVLKAGQGPYSFTAVLPGIGNGIDIHVTKIVMQRWKDLCGVDAMVELA
jgi:hypothetical protein